MVAPKLRFKEFDGDWDKKLLGKIIGISSASRVFKDQWEETGVPFFRTSDVVSIFKNKENEKAYISLELFEELAKKSGKIQKDDLLVTGGGSIGIPYLVPNNEPLYFKDADLLWLKASGIINGSFLYNFFISPKFREYLKSISHTGTISHFTIEQAKATPFCFPIIEEQTKIASFLSAVDEKIAQLSQKLHLLDQYKQGIMQKLFSQQIRFKADDGSEFTEWDKIKLSDVAFTTTGSSNREDSTESSGEYTFFDRSEDIRTSSKYLYDCETLIVPGEGSTFKPKYFKGKFDLHQRAYAIMKFKNIEAKFLYFFIQHHHQYFISAAVGSTVKSLRLPMFQNMPVKLPCLAEQKKIANFLSAIDQKIDVTTEQLEQAKLWKKGLLQQMFV